MTDLSNSLADLAERVREANDAGRAAERTAADKMLVAGRLLCQAKDECPHGEWTPFLERAGVHDRQARRLMQIARSGLSADTVSDLGGFKATLEWLSRWVLPTADDVLFISRAGAETEDAIATVMPSEEPFFFDVSVFMPDGQFVSTEQPVASESIRLGDGSYVNVLRETVIRSFTVPPSEWTFAMGHRYQLLDDCAFLADLVSPRQSGRAPRPSSYKAMIAAMKDCIADFSPERYLRARRAMKIVLSQIEKWPSDPKMFDTFVHIATSGEASRLAKELDRIVLANAVEDGIAAREAEHA